MLDNRKKIWDALLQLASSNTIATASYCTYGASTVKTIDLGGAGFTKGKLVIDVSAVDTNYATVASGQTYDWVLFGSNRASFDSGRVPLARFRLGCVFADPNSVKAAGFGASAGSPSTGRYTIPFINEFGGTTYQYLRLHVSFGGTMTTGVTFSAFLTK